MKKLVSAVTIAALTAGALSAEVKIGLQSRTRPSLFTYVGSYKEDADYSIFGDFSYTGHQDTLTFSTSSDYAGAKLVMKAGTTASSYTNIEGNDTEKLDWGFDGDAYAWIGFGNFKLYGGKISYRGKVNRQNKFGLVDSDRAKYGVSSTINGSSKTFLYDFNDVGTIAGTRHTAMIGEYTLSESLPGDLIFRLGMLANSWKYDDGYVYNSSVKSGGSYIGSSFVFDVTYSQKDFLSLDLVVKSPSQHQLGFGLYGELDMVENLALNLGFTYGMQNEFEYYKTATALAAGVKDGKESKWNAFAVDFRAVYTVSDPFTLAFTAKYSSAKADEADAENSINLALGGKYVFSETVEGNLTFALDMDDLDDNDESDLAENWIWVSPDVTIYAGKNAYFEAGVMFGTAINGGDAEDACKASSDLNITKMNFAIPLVLRCKI